MTEATEQALDIVRTSASDSVKRAVSAMESNVKQKKERGKGQSSKSVQKEPSTPGKTYTEDEVKKLLRERQSKLDRRIHELESQVAIVPKLKSRLVNLAREREEAEISAAKNDPDKLIGILNRYRNKGTKKNSVAKEKAKEPSYREIKALEASYAKKFAKKYGIDAAELLKSNYYGPAEMEAAAIKLVGRSRNTKPAAISYAPTRAELKLDPGTGSGVSDPKLDRLESMSMEEYARFRRRNG